MSVATTTLSQISVGAMMSIGAHSPLGDDNKLILHMGRGLKNKLVIELAGDDTYTLRTCKIKRDYSIEWNTIAEGIYFDQLSDVIISIDRKA